MEISMSSPLPEDGRLPVAFAEAWRTDVAGDSEVRSAYLRFLQRRSTSGRVPALQIAGWLLAGMLLGMGGVYAATGGPWQRPWRGSGGPAPAPVSVHEHAPQPRAANGVQPAREEPPPEPSAPVSNPPVPGAGAHPSPAAAASENWQRAARGLRDRDFESATAALLELEAHAGPAERETAELVRAQLLLSQGRCTEARALLSALRVSARSAAVRQKATVLFEQSSESAVPQRSFPAPPATKLP
jgi:hypothetical protein